MAPLRSVPHQTYEVTYRLLVDSVKDYAIFMLDPDGCVRSWNTGAEAIKGYTAQEILGRHISTFYLPEERHRPCELLAAAARDGRVETEGWRVRKDGSLFWADVVITALRGDNGAIVGYAKVTRDLSTKREAEEALRQSEERFRVLVQSVKDYAIFMLDPAGRVATWNAGAERIKGYRPDEVIGTHFSRFYAPEDVASGKCERDLQVAIETGNFQEEGWRVRKGGAMFWASVVIEPLRSREGTLLGFAKVTRDLTDRRNAEEERVRLAQAQEAIRLRDEFLSIASHELKTPLSAVQLQLEALQQGLSASDEKARARADRAYRGAKRLSDLVETLLDVSRISTGRITLSLSTFDAAQLAAEVVDHFREQAERDATHLTLRVTSPLVGTWDRVRLEQVLSNLLGNALKYAAGTPVELAAHAEGANLVLTVSDAGPGISAQDRKRIFDRFERAASIRHYGGMGLGLYVARQITEAHGGTISVDETPPRGARFTVTLPRQPSTVHQEPGTR